MERRISSENQVLYGLIYKFLGDNKDICDGKEDIYNVGKYILDLPNVGRTKRKYLISSDVERTFNG